MEEPAKPALMRGEREPKPKPSRTRSPPRTVEGILADVMAACLRDQVQFVGGNYVNQKSKLTFKHMLCDSEEFEQTADKRLLGQLGCGCHDGAAAAARRTKPAVLHSLAAAYGGQCLNAEAYEHRKTELRWQCAKGHLFTASLTQIRDRVNFCQFCPSGFRVYEKVLQDLCKDVFNLAFLIDETPPWLRGYAKEKGELRYDLVNYEVRQIIEHHGDQHYTENYYGHKRKALAKGTTPSEELRALQERDETKERLALANGFSFCVVPAMHSIVPRAGVRAAIDALRLSSPHLFTQEAEVRLNLLLALGDIELIQQYYAPHLADDERAAAVRAVVESRGWDFIGLAGETVAYRCNNRYPSGEPHGDRTISLRKLHAQQDCRACADQVRGVGRRLPPEEAIARLESRGWKLKEPGSFVYVNQDQEVDVECLHCGSPRGPGRLAHFWTGHYTCRSCRFASRTDSFRLARQRELETSASRHGMTILKGHYENEASLFLVDFMDGKKPRFVPAWEIDGGGPEPDEEPGEAPQPGEALGAEVAIK